MLHFRLKFSLLSSESALAPPPHSVVCQVLQSTEVCKKVQNLIVQNYPEGVVLGESHVLTGDSKSSLMNTGF